MAIKAWSPMITTKLRPPGGSSDTIDRPRLFQLVSAASSARLIVITAPAGFGKTSFAAAWLARLRAAGHHAAWLTIDPEDDEPARFLHSVAHALLRAADDIDPSAAGLSSETSLLPPRAIVSAMINQLAEIDDDVYLMLDDFHCLTDPAIHDAVSLLVTHAPPNFHLVMTTRALPPLPLARLRANGELLEIDVAALRFDSDETRNFLQQTCTGRLAPTAIARLHASTEGWGAALRLAATSIAQGDVSADALDWAPKRPFAAYIEEILAAWPDEMVEFLTRISVLDSLCSELCRAVTGVSASGDLLESVARRHLLLEGIDSEGLWYRFHRLLRDYLRHRLQTRYADEVPELHRRAFAWYSEHEMWTDAARHAIAAGDKERALEWVARCGMTLVKRGDLLTLLGWQRQLPSELMRSQIKLRLAIAWGMTLAMRVDEAQVLLDQIEQDTRVQVAGPEQADVLWECQVLRAVTFVMSDDSTAALALAEACSTSPNADPWNANVLSNVLRFGRWKAGDVDGFYAAPWIPYLVEQNRGNVFLPVYHHYLLGLLELDRTRFDLAERNARESMRLAELHVGPYSTAAAIVAPLLAELLYERGRFEEAEDLLVERLPTIDALVMLDGVRRSYVVLTRIAASRSAFEHAYGLLAAAEALGYNRKWDRLVSGVLLERMRLLLREGRLGEASSCVVRLERLAALNPVTSPCAHTEIHQDWNLARIELACEHNRWAEVLTLLEGLHRDAQAVHNVRLMMQLKSRLAVALMASNDTDGALQAMRSALDLAAPAGAYRSILDAGPDVGLLLTRFRASSRCTKALEAHCERLLAGCKGMQPAEPDHAQPVVASLSRREQEILAQIAEGHSNKEVARALGVTPETVKTHLKNVFEKLSVERRAQAVARARSLGLL